MVEYKSHSKSAQASGRLDAAFSAMADPTRRAILARLALADARVTEIAADFPVSLNAVSKHIKMLERAELVRRTVRGRDHILSLNAGAMAERPNDSYYAVLGRPDGGTGNLCHHQRNSARKGKRK